MKIDVKHIARLARLGLTQAEEKKFEKELSAILDFVAKLNKAKTKNIEPTSHVTGASNVLRGDEESPICHDESVKKDILKNAPAEEKGYFKVKRVLG